MKHPSLLYEVALRRLVVVRLSLLLLLAVGCQAKPPAKPLERHEFVQAKWGTGFKIILYAPDAATAKQAAEAAFARVDELTDALSDYDPNSELSRLCRLTDDGPMTQPVPVSHDLFHVLERSQQAARESNGAFDVTVGPLVRLWRRSRDMGTLPTDERLAKTRPSVGYQHVQLQHQVVRHTGGRPEIVWLVQLKAPRMRLDFGGIATGYATDEMLAVMRERGINRALVDAGGDLAAGDPPPGADGWRVAVQGFPDPTKTVGYVKIRNRAISTSGDTYRYVEIDGVRYSHIVDPRTGLGLTRRIGATVIADDGMTADWLDTALPVMDPQEAIALVEQIEGAAARITTLEDGGIKVYESALFKSFWDAPPAAGFSKVEGPLQ